MKKELQELLTLSENSKTLKINGIYKVESVPLSEMDSAIEVATHLRPPVKMMLTLKGHNMTRRLYAATPQDLKVEIATVMAEMEAEHVNRMLKDWENGYILGSVIEESPTATAT